MSRKSINNKGLVYYVAAVSVAFFICSCSPAPVKPIVQAPLPYAENALEPYISANTLSFHYGKHHAGYIKTMNRLLENHKLNGKTLDEVVVRAAKDKQKNAALFNSAAQAWNHQFFWNSMTPDGGGEPGQVLKEKIVEAFGSFDAFKVIFMKAAGDVFGSGWVWLVEDDDGLAIVITSNADTPLVYGMKPLFTVDVWEHSYYLDYQNNRSEYVQSILEHLVNWKHVESLLEKH